MQFNRWTSWRLEIFPCLSSSVTVPIPGAQSWPRRMSPARTSPTKQRPKPAHATGSGLYGPLGRCKWLLHAGSRCAGNRRPPARPSSQTISATGTMNDTSLAAGGRRAAGGAAVRARVPHQPVAPLRRPAAARFSLRPRAGRKARAGHSALKMESRALPLGLARARPQSLRGPRGPGPAARTARATRTRSSTDRAARLHSQAAMRTTSPTAPQRGPGLRLDAPVRSSRAFPAMIVSS